MGGTFARAQQPPLHEESPVDQRYRDALFDFHWSGQLHRFFDARNKGDSKLAEAELQEWEKIDKDITFVDRAQRKQLVFLARLLLENKDSFRSKLYEMAVDKNTAWTLLLALEQMDSRLGSPQPDRRQQIETTIRNRGERFLIAYLKDAYTTKQISLIVCQAASRIRDDQVALKLLQQTTEAIELRGGQPNLPVTTLLTERLVALASTDNCFRDDAYSSCKKLCELLEKDTDHHKSHPLALAKARRTLATLELSDESKVNHLQLALHVLDNVEFGTDSFPNRWYWEARREFKIPQEFTELQQVNELFKYRRAALRVALLLDGYPLLLRKRDDQRANLFGPAQVAKSLQELAQFQKSFTVAAVDELRTLLSCWTIWLEAPNVLDSDEAQSILDEAMKIAWSLRDNKSLSDSSRRLVCECQLAWVENCIKNGDLASNPRLLLPTDPLEVIQTLEHDEHFNKQDELVRRCQKSKLAIVLASDSLEDARELLHASRNDAKLEALWLNSLELLLATRTSDLESAEKLGKTVRLELKNETELQSKLLPLYALSEYEVEHGLSSMDPNREKSPIILLHETIDELESKNLRQHSATTGHFKVANQLHIVIAGVHYSQTDSTSSEAQTFKILLQKTSDSINQHPAVELEESPARKVLRHIIQSATGNLKHRAVIALATDQLKSVKRQRTNQLDDTVKSLREKFYSAKEALKKSEEEAEGLGAKLRTMAKNAKEIIKSSDRSQFDVLEAEYRNKEKEHNRAVDETNKRRDKLLVDYDQLFREPKPFSYCCEAELRENLNLIIPLIAPPNPNDNSNLPINLLYNAQCVAMESALLLDPKTIGENTLELLDRFAKNLPSQSLAIRKKWADKETDKERVFSQYQLGFELAVRWFTSRYANSLKQADLIDALDVVAQNTNRSFLDSRNLRSTDIKQRLELLSESWNADHGSCNRFPSNFIAYFSGNESLHVFWRFDGLDIQHAQSSVNRATLDSTIDRLLAFYRNSNSSHSTRDLQSNSRLLSGWLLPKALCDSLNTVSSEREQPCVYVAPHGPLFRIPLEGLNVLGKVASADSQDLSSQPLEIFGDRLPLIYLPSLATETQAVAQMPRQTSRSLLTIQPGDDVGLESGKLFDLGKKLTKCDGKSTVNHLKPDSRFNKTDVFESLKMPSGWEIVHFGCHAKGDTDTAPTRSSSEEARTLADSYILLLDEDNPVDEFRLSTRNLYQEFSGNLQLNAKHVFLSACETNSPNVNDLLTGGNSHKTLCTAFLVIGAEDVIASHWRVDAPATQALFENIAGQYGNYIEQQPAQPPSTEAVAWMLFNARKNVRVKKSDWSRIYFWNAFTLWSAHWLR